MCFFLMPMKIKLLFVKIWRKVSDCWHLSALCLLYFVSELSGVDSKILQIAQVFDKPEVIFVGVEIFISLLLADLRL